MDNANPQACWMCFLDSSYTLSDYLPNKECIVRTYNVSYFPFPLQSTTVQLFFSIIPLKPLQQKKGPLSHCQVQWPLLCSHFILSLGSFPHEWSLPPWNASLPWLSSDLTSPSLMHSLVGSSSSTGPLTAVDSYHSDTGRHLSVLFLLHPSSTLFISMLTFPKYISNTILSSELQTLRFSWSPDTWCPIVLSNWTYSE